ncbi:hypothetical protein SEEM0055_02848, partial [Salmonella enterica subsp. enterica serovar Montevideo str. MB110209-0055]
MVIDNALHNRQPQPCAAGATGAVAAYKRLEQMFTLLRLNARPVIFYLEPGAMRLGAATDLNPAVAIRAALTTILRHR